MQYAKSEFVRLQAAAEIVDTVMDGLRMDDIEQLIRDYEKGIAQ